jgi:hypothetical protein
MGKPTFLLKLEQSPYENEACEPEKSLREIECEEKGVAVDSLVEPTPL